MDAGGGAATVTVDVLTVVVTVDCVCVTVAGASVMTAETLTTLVFGFVITVVAATAVVVEDPAVIVAVTVLVEVLVVHAGVVSIQEHAVEMKLATLDLLREDSVLEHWALFARLCILAALTLTVTMFVCVLACTTVCVTAAGVLGNVNPCVLSRGFARDRLHSSVKCGGRRCSGRRIASRRSTDCSYHRGCHGIGLGVDRSTCRLRQRVLRRTVALCRCVAA